MQRKKAEKGAADPDSDPSGKSKKIKKGGGLLSKLCFILGVVLCTILSACIGGYVGGVWDSMSDRVVEMQRRLFDACQRNQVENVRQILEEGANVNYRYGELKSTLLESAVTYGNIEVLSLLLAKGANPSTKNRGGTTALHLAGLCRGGTFEESRPLSQSQHCQPMALQLLQAGADPNTVMPETGVRPLHLFADQKAEDVVRLLLEKGADPNAAMTDGSTALHVVGELQKDAQRAAVVLLLLKSGADPTLPDQSGARPDVADVVGALAS